MKTLKATILAIVAVLSLSSAAAQESPFSVGADLVSSYVWRGGQYGGPSVQPGVSYAAGNFEIGAWGSWDFVTYAPSEADLYLSYGFDFGLSLGLTDYFYQGSGSYFDYSDAGTHAIELNAGYGIGDLSIAANYIFNESAGAGSAGGDMYFELDYAFEYFNVFVGAGDGWHTASGNFNVCNVGIGTSKEVKISESFSLPVFGQVILNPNSESYHIVVGISL